MRWFKRLTSLFASQPDFVEPKFFKGHHRLIEALYNEYAPYVAVWDLNVGTTGKIIGWLVAPMPGDCSEIKITPVVEERSIKKHVSGTLYGTDEVVQIATINDLRNSISGLPGDVRIAFSVAAKDGSAWFMNATLTQQPRGCSCASIQLTHPQLDTLKDLE